MRMNWDGLLGSLAGLLVLALGLAQIGLGAIGIEHHLGSWAAIAAVLTSFIFRLMLPLTIGTYFGVVDVIGWPWWAGVLIAVPGIVFMVPALVSGFVGAIADRFR